MTNFDSAWFLYGALFLLLATSFVVRIDYARVGLAAAAFVALPLTLFRGSDLGYSLLVLAILAVNIGILARLWLRGTNISFSAEEEALRREHFTGLGAGAARDLIDQGHWISAKRGEVLIRENQAAPSLFYLAEGQAAVLRDGVEVGKLSGGALIGEATALDGAHATGTVVLGSNARLWFVPAAALRAYLAANPAIAGALHEGFARALRGKLASANTRIADPPPIS
ncbi:cyclic nucleotide-binding domain-containing protein [Sphingopyxis sp. SE2]|uniref:Crp/Fnr family transcriptional regulator n=1 Tax=unclassified Sphingopyxis TaxID=2614943 RepID=UPI00050DBB66|nr:MULTISPECIES: cyclic nucleotide-binding domain-containing protein [unclassified Sphingopyxis]KGB56477.1 Cyclic nucleotide-binding protein [Sphingopyxis sp. LC363]MDT7529317.1 cyclic nucleotide-binding domain-containing protein [Sphingopyxis sp. SE2]